MSWHQKNILKDFVNMNPGITKSLSNVIKLLGHNLQRIWTTSLLTNIKQVWKHFVSDKHSSLLCNTIHYTPKKVFIAFDIEFVGKKSF